MTQEHTDPADFKFIAAPDVAALTVVRSRVLAAAGDLLELMQPQLPPNIQAAIDAVIADGGALAVEARVDGRGNTAVALTLVTQGGVRRELAHVHTIGQQDASSASH